MDIWLKISTLNCQFQLYIYHCQLGVKRSNPLSVSQSVPIAPSDFIHIYDNFNLFGAVQCSAVRCAAVRCGALRCSAVQWSAVLWSAGQVYLFLKWVISAFNVIREFAGCPGPPFKLEMLVGLITLGNVHIPYIDYVRQHLETIEWKLFVTRKGVRRGVGWRHWHDCHERPFIFLENIYLNLFIFLQACNIISFFLC